MSLRPALGLALVVSLAAPAGAAPPRSVAGRSVDVQVGDADVRVMVRTPARELGLPASADEDELIAAAKLLAVRLLAETTLEIDESPLGEGRVLDTKLAMGAEPRADVLLAWPLEVPASQVAIWTAGNSPGPDAVSVFERREGGRPVLVGAATIRAGGHYAALLGRPAPDYSPGRPLPAPVAGPVETPRATWALGVGLLAVSLGALGLWRRGRRRAE